MTYFWNPDGVKMYITHFLHIKAIRIFLQHLTFREEFDAKKILGNSLGKLIEKLFEYKFEKTIKIFLFIKTTLSAQNGNQK